MAPLYRKRPRRDVRLLPLLALASATALWAAIATPDWRLDGTPVAPKIVQKNGRLIIIRDPQQVDTNVYWFALDPGHGSYAATLATVAATASSVPPGYGTYAVTAGANGCAGLNIVGPVYGLSGLSISSSGVCRDIFSYACSRNPNYAAPTYHTNGWGDQFQVWGQFLEAPQRLPTTGEDARLADAKGVGSKTIIYIGQDNVGTGDGSSYLNRRRVRDFTGLNAGTEATVNPQTKDIIVLCGRLSRFSTEDDPFIYLKAGISSARTVVLSHPTDRAELMGGVKWASWTADSGGAYYKDFTEASLGTPGTYFALSDVSGSVVALDMVASLALCRSTASSYFISQVGGNPDRLYVHNSAGADPAATTYVVNGGILLGLLRAEYFDVYGVVLYQQQMKGAFHQYNSNWRFIASKMLYGGSGKLFSTSGNAVNIHTGQFVSSQDPFRHVTPEEPQNRTLLGSEIAFQGDGIYDDSESCVAPIGTVVRDTYWHHIGVIAHGGNIGDNDSHTMACYGGVDGLIFRNCRLRFVCHNTIVLYPTDTGCNNRNTTLTDGVVTNGAFTTDVSGWTDKSTGGGTRTWYVSGAMQLTANGGVGAAEQAITVSAPYVNAARKHVIKFKTYQVIVRIGTTSGGQEIMADTVVYGNPETQVAAVAANITAATFYVGYRTTGTAYVWNVELLLNLASEEGYVRGFPVAGEYTTAAGGKIVMVPNRNIDISYNWASDAITTDDNPLVGNQGAFVEMAGDITYDETTNQLHHVRIHHNIIEGGVTFGTQGGDPGVLDGWQIFVRLKWQVGTPFDYTRIEIDNNKLRGLFWAFRAFSTFPDVSGNNVEGSFSFHHNDVHVIPNALSRYVLLSATANPTRHRQILDNNIYRISTGAKWETGGAVTYTTIAAWRAAAGANDNYDNLSTHVA